MLEARGVRFVELHHRDVPTAQEVAHQEHFSGHRVAKVIVVIADGRPVELVLPASRQVNLELARRAVGAREVRLATEMEMERYFKDCEVGAVPPLRHWKGVDVYMDRSLGVEGDILFQEGTHRDAVRINFHDWFNIVQPKVNCFSVEPEPACV
jgi:Ala-tRNA(Pro) deacylase